MLVRRRLVSLSVNSRVNLRMVGITTIIAVSIAIVIVMVRREGILMISWTMVIKEHIQTMEAISRVM